MQSLREQPIVSLADDAEMDTFIADIFQPRPAFDDIARFSKEWSTEAVKEMRQAMKRKNCAVTWAQLVIDQHGLLAFLRVANPLHLGNVKLAAKVLFKCLPAPFTNEQRCAVQKSLRPLGEVDRDRISAWQTVDSLRPAGQKRKRPCKQDESEQDYRPPIHRPHVTEEYRTLAEQAKILESNAKPMAELLAEESSSEEEVVLQALRLMLTDGSEQPQTLAVPNILDPASVWEYRAKSEAVIIVAEAGARPERLAFRRCHHESRRQLLLQSKVREEYKSPGMQHVVRVAMKLVKDGSMPGPGEHGRKSEFIRRCATALQALDPSEETDLKKLDSPAQALIRQALGGDMSTPYDGCLNEDCLDKETIWKTYSDALRGEPVMERSHCAHCGRLKSFGRSVNSVRDILQKAFRFENGRVLQTTALVPK